MKRFCIWCKKTKSIELFGNKKQNGDGINNICKKCMSEYLKKRKDTPEVLEARRIREEKAEKNKRDAEIRKRRRAVARPMYHAAVALNRMSPLYEERKREKNRNAMRKKRKDPAFKKKEKETADRLRSEGYFKQYNKNNKHKLRKKTKNPWTKTKEKIRKCIKRVLDRRGISKDMKTLEILGVKTWTEAIKHLGYHVDGMHIDHIIPLAFAEKGNLKELYALNSIWNLRRISAEENMAKGDSVPSRDLLHPNLPPLAMEIYERNCV